MWYVPRVMDLLALPRPASSSSHITGPHGLQERADSGGPGGDRSIGAGGRLHDVPGYHGHGLRLERHLPCLLQDVPHHHHVRGEVRSGYVWLPPPLVAATAPRDMSHLSP